MRDSVKTGAASTLTLLGGMQFVPVPIKGGPSEGKRLLVCIHETRRSDYEHFAKDPKVSQYLSRYSKDSLSELWKKPPFPEFDSKTGKDTGRVEYVQQQPEFPVVQVSWAEAAAYCDWLTVNGRASGGLAATQKCRLPTDHEWSCMVGGLDREDPALSPGKKHQKIMAFAWQTPNEAVWDGKVPLRDGEAGNLCDQSHLARWPWMEPLGISPAYRDGFPLMAPVMRFKASSKGIYDLSGNVEEWVSDDYGEHYSQPKTAKLTRGTSYLSANLKGTANETLYSSHRSRMAGVVKANHIGFRCVIEDEKK